MIEFQTITPISSIFDDSTQVKSIQATDTDTSNKVITTAQVPFMDLFVSAYNNVEETNQVLENEIIKVVLGESDDLHSVSIASAQAGLAVDLVVQIRNKALEAYNSVMSTSL